MLGFSRSLCRLQPGRDFQGWGELAGVGVQGSPLGAWWLTCQPALGPRELTGTGMNQGPGFTGAL